MGWNGKSDSNVTWSDEVSDEKIDEYEALLAEKVRETSEAFFDDFFKEEIERGEVMAFY